MENTNEREELVTLDSVGDCSVEQGEGTCGTCEAGETISARERVDYDGETFTRIDCDVASEKEADENATTDEGNEDVTMRVLRLYPKVCARISELMCEQTEAMALELIEKGIGYDDAIAEADKGGYLRGKNEKIELMKGHRMPQSDVSSSKKDAEESCRDGFPRYVKRNFWED